MSTQEQKNKFNAMDTSGIELRASSLQFAKTTISPTWWVPREIRIERDCFSEQEILVWRDSPNVEKHYIRSFSVTGLLRAFYRLAEIPEEKFSGEVLKFAKKWGVFGTWPRESFDENGYERYEKGYENRIKINYLCEPLDIWRQFARTTKAMLDLDMKLREGKTTNKDDWKDVRPQAWNERMISDYLALMGLSWKDVRPQACNERGIPVGKKQERAELSHALNSWLSMTQMRLSFVWEETDNAKAELRVNLVCWPTGWTNEMLEKSTNERWDMAEAIIDPIQFKHYPMRPSPLYNALCFQLAAALAASKLRSCERCKFPFELKHGRTKYCEDCKLKQASERTMESRKRKLGG